MASAASDLRMSTYSPEFETLLKLPKEMLEKISEYDGRRESYKVFLLFKESLHNSNIWNVQVGKLKLQVMPVKVSVLNLPPNNAAGKPMLIVDVPNPALIAVLKYFDAKQKFKVFGAAHKNVALRLLDAPETSKTLIADVSTFDCPLANIEEKVRMIPLEMKRQILKKILEGMSQSSIYGDGDAVIYLLDVFFSYNRSSKKHAPDMPLFYQIFKIKNPDDRSRIYDAVVKKYAELKELSIEGARHILLNDIISHIRNSVRFTIDEQIPWHIAMMDDSLRAMEAILQQLETSFTIKLYGLMIRPDRISNLVYALTSNAFLLLAKYDIHIIERISILEGMMNVDKMDLGSILKQTLQSLLKQCKEIAFARAESQIPEMRAIMVSMMYIEATQEVKILSNDIADEKHDLIAKHIILKRDIRSAFFNGWGLSIIDAIETNLDPGIDPQTLEKVQTLLYQMRCELTIDASASATYKYKTMNSKK